MAVSVRPQPKNHSQNDYHPSTEMYNIFNSLPMTLQLVTIPSPFEPSIPPEQVTSIRLDGFALRRGTCSKVNVPRVCLIWPIDSKDSSVRNYERHIQAPGAQDPSSRTTIPA